MLPLRVKAESFLVSLWLWWWPSTLGGLLWWLNGKELTCHAGDEGLLPGLGRSPGEDMATHSGILVWPSMLQSTGSQRVGLD